MNKILKKTLIGLGAVLVIGAAAGLFVYNYTLEKYSGESQRLVFPTGSGKEAVKDTLESRLGDYGSKVYRLWDAQGGATMSGSYVLEHGATALSVSRMMRRGMQTPVKVAFNNCRSLADVAERACRNVETTPEQFLAVCDTLLPTYGFSPAEFPAAFIPDTYEAYWNTKPEAFVRRLLDSRNAFWTDERKAKAEKLGLTKVQVATLASIVEGETTLADEQPIVARLYLNRLAKGMRLQADPTVKFAVGDPTLRRILIKHTEVDSPYNTYKYAGLPPGPISVPSRQALDAVLNAPANDYLYMCAKEDFSGRHNFTANYQEHLANARRFQAELNRRGIK